MPIKKLANKFFKNLVFIAFTIYLFLNHATAQSDQGGQKSIKVESCNRILEFTDPPKRAVSNDINLTEMMFALGLQKHMVGYTGITGWQKLTDEFKQSAGKIPQLAEKSPTIETLLSVDADFLFAGWNYGMRVGGPLTPSTLGDLGIEVYELTESCIHIMDKADSTFDDVFNDLSNLGVIFNVSDRSDELIKQLKMDMESITQFTNSVREPVSVFLYDSGKETPFTAGSYAIPSAMIHAAGGRNITGHLKSSWTRTNWESVVIENPDIIIIVNYGATTAVQKMDFLRQHPALTEVTAIKRNKFIVLEYSEVTPGIRNFSATKKLAAAFHPTHWSKSYLSKSYLSKNYLSKNYLSKNLSSYKEKQ